MTAHDRASYHRASNFALANIAPDPVAQYVEEALRLVALGTLVPTISQTFPLDRAIDAHAAMEARATRGKTLLIP